MGHAEICPVCKGSGVYKHYRDYMELSGGVCCWEQTCHGCSGKGWVTVPDYNNQVPPFFKTMEFCDKSTTNSMKFCDEDNHIPHID